MYMGYEEQLIPGLPNDLCELFMATLPRREFGNLRLVCKSWKKLFSSEKLCEIRREVKASEGWIYVMAEIPAGAPFKAYDSAANKWFDLPPTPGRSENEFWEGFACVAVGTNLLLMGGVRGSINVRTQKRSSGSVCRDVCKYDALENRWSAAKSMNTARSWFAAATIGDCVYVAGGQGSSSFLNTAEVYDAKQNKWQNLPSMHCVRSSCVGLAIDQQFWVIAGEFMINDVRPKNGSAEIFDPDSGSWKLTSEMWLDAEKVPGPGTVWDGRPLFVHNSTLMAYRKMDNSWEKLGQLHGGQLSGNSRSSSCFGFACVSLDAEVYVVGGTRESWLNRNRYCAVPLDTVEVCNIRECVANGRMLLPWRSVAPLQTSMGPILAATVLYL